MSAQHEARVASGREIVRIAVVRLRARVMALVGAMVGGAGVSLTTVWHVLQRGNLETPDLRLLGNYFPGYTVSWSGACLGLIYGAIGGAVLGWIVAWVYNRVSMIRHPL